MAFLGTAYRGWQRQSNAGSIQQVIESALSEILKEPVTIMGCGRTDAQVHASQFYFHADINARWDFDLLFRLNKALPADLAVYEILPMQGYQHARFDAMLRQYDYFIHTCKDPFLNPVSTLIENNSWKLDKMKQAVALLTRYNDYRAFCKTPDDYEHTRCNVSSAGLFINERGNRLRFQISADRFLGRMVRLLAGKLIKIGSGSLSVDEFESYFVEKATPEVWDPAYPQGLFLSKVNYPYLQQPACTDFDAIHFTEGWQKI
ncbi:MAG: tRNA pseudouridine(38-40) synthase TruA [Cyclobacteriaceae bacterium]|nr:tRNA pseudouridine(38-40) synthase TruA [Cyclobacteriaceae bacterium]